jgi:hypothetical protein
VCGIVVGVKEASFYQRNFLDQFLGVSTSEISSQIPSANTTRNFRIEKPPARE